VGDATELLKDLEIQLIFERDLKEILEDGKKMQGEQRN